MKADEEKINALAKLCTRGQPSDDTLTGIEKLVCQVYVPNTVIDNVKELTWWHLDTVSEPQLQSPETFGWK